MENRNPVSTQNYLIIYLVGQFYTVVGFKCGKSGFSSRLRVLFTVDSSRYSLEQIATGTLHSREICELFTADSYMGLWVLFTVDSSGYSLQQTAIWVLFTVDSSRYSLQQTALGTLYSRQLQVLFAVDSYMGTLYSILLYGYSLQ